MTEQEFAQIQDQIERLLLSGEQENIDLALSMTRRGEMQLVEAALRKKYRKVCRVFGWSFETIFTQRYLRVENRTKVFPENLQNLQRANLLHLSGWHIGLLPECITEMRELKSLYLYNCKLSFLPESIGNLYNLRYLDISRNDISSLPKSLIKIPNLTLYACDTKLDYEAVFNEFTNIKTLIYAYESKVELSGSVANIVTPPRTLKYTR